MNLILGLAIILIMTSAFDEVLLTEKILGFRDNSTSSQKLQVNDEIVKIDSTPIFTADDIQFTLMISKKDTFDVTVRRNGEKVKLSNVKFNTSYDYYYDDNGYLVKSTNENYAPQGREVQHYEGIFDFAVTREGKTPLKILGYTFRAEASYIQLIFTSLRELLTGGVSFRDMSGPVGIVSGISETVDQSVNIREKIYDLLNITMLITINVGVFNLLPLPALDGGRLVFLIIEGIRRKKIKPELEAKIHATGLALLMVLIVIITFNDVFNLFTR
jgi:regulator of sigma E protease